MNKLKAKVLMDSEFVGHLQLDNYRVEISEDKALPYDLLQGALASCLHSTFLGVLEEEGLNINFVEYNISGNKRDSVPTTFEFVEVKASIDTASSEAKVREAMKVASERCSIYQTIAQVATMELIVEFASMDSC